MTASRRLDRRGASAALAATLLLLAACSSSHVERQVSTDPGRLSVTVSAGQPPADAASDLIVAGGTGLFALRRFEMQP